MKCFKFFALFVLFLGFCLAFGQLTFRVEELQFQEKTIWVNPEKTEMMLVNEPHCSISLVEKNGQVIKRRKGFSYSPAVMWYTDQQASPEEVSLFKSIIK